MQSIRGKLLLLLFAVSVVILNALPAGAVDFAAGRSFDTGNATARSVTSGDFNGDGKPDLAVADYSSGTVSILLGEGSGGFVTAVSYAVGSSPWSVTTADFNGDGKLDLAVANESSGNVSILLGNGSGGFAAAINYAVGTNPYSVTTGDFNGDGKLDLAVANNSPGNVSILLGDGSGGFAAAVNYAVGTNPRSVTSGDFNGDGKLDLAVANQGSGTVSILSGNGSGGFAAAVSYAAGTSSQSVTSGDFNGDGKPDLAVANQGSGTVSILLGNGSGGFAAAVNYTVGSNPLSVTSGDFNGDGKLDLAVLNYGFSSSGGNISMLLGDGNGVFGAAISYSDGTNPWSIMSDDFNGDGKPDLAVANYGSGTVSIRLGGGSGGFAAAVSYTVGTNPWSVTSGDFNGDGKPDLAVANAVSGDVSILLGDGSGGFAAAVNYVTGNSPQSVTSGDFNGDGKLDLAVANFNSNNISILLGDGSGGFAAAFSCAAGSGPYSVTSGDFNGDGKSDLAVANNSPGNISIFLGDGSGGFAAAVNYSSGSRPQSVTSGDFNGDGKLDLVVSNAGSFSVLLNTTPVPIIGVTPASLNFGSIASGSTSSGQPVTISNSGTASLVVSGITFGGANGNQFSLAAGSCPSLTPTIAVGSSCTVNVSFAPTSTGDKSAILQIAGNDPAHLTMGVSLTGTAVQPTYPLTVTFPGNGSGSISGTTTGTPAIVSFSSTGSSSISAGAAVSLTASSNPGAVFTGWGGACSGTDGCSVTMDQARSVSATFALLPTVATGAATGITYKKATLNGTVSANGTATAVSFEYGLTASYGSTVTAVQSPLAPAASDAAVSAPITGLTCETVYHFRVTGQNGLGTTTGLDATVSTATCPVHGACGSSSASFANAAPSDGFCSAGTPTAVSGDGPWRWQCAGLYGGTTASCITYLPGFPPYPVSLAPPTPRFRDNGDGSLSDQYAGLMWAKDAGVMASRDPAFDGDAVGGDGMVTWQHALDYVKKLNADKYLGFEDWRLPNILELVNHPHDDVASNVPAYVGSEAGKNAYWSSTAYLPDPQRVWTVYTWYESRQVAAKSDLGRVWPVRDTVPGTIALPQTGQNKCYGATGSEVPCEDTGQDGEFTKGLPQPIPRFVDNNNQTITDNFTGIIWSKDVSPLGPAACTPAGPMNWDDAQAFIGCLNSNNWLGKNDWRLPSATELTSLVHWGVSSSSWLTGTGFSVSPAAPIFSADFADPFATVVTMAGESYGSHRTVMAVVWPIRGGQLHTISVAKDGNGSGDLTSNPVGIACIGAACISTQKNFVQGTVVALTATPASGSTFAGWEQAGRPSECDTISGATCTVTATGNKNALATFVTAATVVDGLCGGSHGGTFDVKPRASLCELGVASAVSGSGHPWTWDCAGVNGGVMASCSAVITQYPLTVTRIGSAAASGIIMAAGGSVTWTGNTGSALLDVGTVITLTPEVDGSNDFTGWSGACSGRGVCSVTMSAARDVTANFITYPPKTVAIAAGFQYTIALREDGTVWGWGTNINGQLGTGTRVERSSIVQASGLDNVTAIATGNWHSLALKADGSVWAWGLNTSGELGDGTIAERLAPVPVSFLSSVKAIAVGNWHSLALKADGTVWAWGGNLKGQLGDGSTTDRRTPTRVNGLSGIVAIVAGDYHNLAIDADGRVWAWGENGLGQLGDGTINQRLVPVPVSGITAATAIAAGSRHSVALLADKTVLAWGDNFASQLGETTATYRPLPAPVNGLSAIKAISAAGYHSLALKEDGTVLAWGDNDYRQLGDGTTIRRATPVPVKGLGEVTAVSAGTTHSVALKVDGSHWTWGDNGYAQLGDNTITPHLDPIKANMLTPCNASVAAGYFAFLANAYLHAAPGEVIKTKGILHPEVLDTYRAITITLAGGYDAGFIGRTQETVIQGLIVTSGAVIIDGITIQ